MGVFGVMYMKLDEAESKAYDDAKRQVKIDWPTLLDPEEKFVTTLYPPGGLKYTFVIVNKDRTRLTYVLDMDQLPEAFDKAVKGTL